MRLMTWNIHGARDASVEGIAEEIRGHAPDVVCLNEVRRGHGKRLGKLVGMRAYEAVCFIGPYGNAILAKEPARSFQRLRFSGVRRVDRRDAAIATTTSGLTVVAVHLNVKAEERMRNARELLAKIQPSTVVAGDMNEAPDGPVARLMRERFDDACAAHPVPTFPATQPVARIDFVWLPREARVKGATAHATTRSDHLPVVVDFEVGS